MLTLVLVAALSQTPGDEAAPAPPPAAQPAPAAQPGEPAVAPVAPVRNKAADDVTRAAKKAQELPPEERQKALQDLQAQYGGVDMNPVLPPPTWAMDRFVDLPPADQVRVIARHWLEDLIAGDSRAVIAAAGLPFYLEDRRLERPDELRNEWVRLLRSRRTDLLALYSIEVLTPAEMEKKYGKAPQRLARWDARGPNTYFAVANLSGHATVLLLKQAGLTWQVTAFHD